MTLHHQKPQHQFIKSHPFMSGLGLRPVHYPHLLARPQTKVEWFEVISENFMDTEGKPLTVLESMRKDFPIAFHGVSLSIGSPEPLSLEYLQKLKVLIDRIDPFIVSDHFCWTGAHSINTHDLLPIPATNKSLQLVVEKVIQVQDFLKRPILLENASSYISYMENEMSETEFNTTVAKQSGCGLLLDINNVYVTCTNFGLDPYTYLEQMPLDKIGQIHLAGFTDMGNYLFDTHSKPVYPAVWDLYRYFIQRKPDVPVMIEWDQDIPEFSVLEAEIHKAVTIREQGL